MLSPLADRIRPEELEDICGQKHLLADGMPLRNIIDGGQIPNMIFYGPSGVGKTTLANIIAKRTDKAFRKLNGTTASTGVKIVASPTLAQYDALAADVTWLDKLNSALVVNGAEWAKIKGVLHGAHLSATQQAAAEELGFRDVIVVPGMTPRACIVPVSSIGFIGRVPAIVANYKEAGAQTDPDSGLSIGIVVADDQEHNRIVVNGDLWFGACVKSANAAATEAGIIKVGTAG